MQSNTIDGIQVMPPLQLDYRLDPTIEVIHEPISFEQGISFKYHSGLNNTNDITFNKFTNFYLTDQHKISDIIRLKPLPDEYPETISTYLAFNRLNNDPLSGLSALSGETCLTAASAVSALAEDDTVSEYLTILTDQTGSSTGTDLTTVTKKLSAEKFIGAKLRDTLEQKFYFNITFINGVDCVVSHVDGESRYFLCHRDDGSAELQFEEGVLEPGLEHDPEEIIALFSDERHLFKYTYYRDHNIIRLYKEHFSKMKIVELISDEDRAKPAFAGVPPLRLTTILPEYHVSDPGSDFDIDTNYPNVLELTDRTAMRVRPPTTKLSDVKLDSKIVNYEQSNDLSNLNVNTNTSTQGLLSNHLLHSEYYYLTGNSLPVNMLTLKNQLTSKERLSTQNLWTGESIHQQRDYNKLFTGTNQLRGTDRIYFDYTVKQFEIEFQSGMNYFNTPQNMEPVKRLNINDSKLYECGAIGSDNPSRSDKIYKQRANYSDTTRWGDPTDEHTGTWLCTWLSAGDDPSVQPVWVDRYYNPSTSSYISALTSVSDPHNTYSSIQTDAIFARGDGVYDKTSDLTLEPGCMYAYYRVSSRDMINNLKQFDPVYIQKGLDEYTSTTNLPKTITDDSQEYVLDGSTYGKIKGTKQLGNEMGTELSIAFDINIKNWQSPVGHQLFGNYTNSGIGLFNTNDVSPFVFVLGSDGTNVGQVTQNTSIRIYDKKFKLYNYVTNNGHLKDTDTPGYFIDIVVREFPDNIYALLSTGDILEIDHDGVVLASYNPWSQHYGTVFTNTISDLTYDNRYIYILTHTGTGEHDYDINTFDMVNKTFTVNSIVCQVAIPVPDEFIDNSVYDYGRSIKSGPPNLIAVKDDPPPYQHTRNIYVGYGDSIKVGGETLWVHVKGLRDSLSGFQTKHDAIYGLDIKTLQLLPGKMYDTGVEDTNLKLSIQDYTVDTADNLWVVHSGNVLSKFTKNRDIISTQILDEREVMSIVVTRSFESGDIVENLLVLSRSIGGEELGVQIGPTPHPTALLNGRAYRKASGWYQSGVFYSRPTTTAEIVNYDTDDETIPFDDTQHIIYPFIEGDSRFGTHVQDIDTIVSTDRTGIVLNDDYSTLTEDFDYLVTEVDDTIFVENIDPVTNKIVDTIQLPTLTVTDINNFPSMITSHAYTKNNFEKYHKHGLNLKMLLQPKFAAVEPDLVNLKIDLSEWNSNLPYTGYHNICVNINNNTGRVEVYIDGHLNETDNVYTFEPGKYTFNDMFTRELLVGASSYLNETTVQSKIKNYTTYTTRDTCVKNINIINKCLTRADIVCLMLSYSEVDNIKWALPNGLRNSIEGVDQVFNHSLPPRKSNNFNVNVRNSEIKSTQLQQYITNKLRKTLDRITPAGTKIAGVNWYNEILD